MDMALYDDSVLYTNCILSSLPAYLCSCGLVLVVGNS